MKRNLIQRLVLLGLSLAFLTNCSSINRSQTGAVLGATTTTAGCVGMGVNDPYAIATCAVIGTFAGAEIMYNSDYDVHNAVFVDHLNNGPQGQSYTNWYNGKTGNSGIIKVTRSYIEGPIKCKDYDATIDITNQWPLIGIGGVNREVVFGTACQLPDGRWVEKDVLKQIQR
jgi:surface antigen